MITLFSIIALGFFLGMRHATDPDHVIAVTTIVSRQRSVRHAALIGALWGVGHTITILAVGSAIILFGLVVPPRLGLTMELSVGSRKRSHPCIRVNPLDGDCTRILTGTASSFTAIRTATARRITAI